VVQLVPIGQLVPPWASNSLRASTGEEFCIWAHVREGKVSGAGPGQGLCATNLIQGKVFFFGPHDPAVASVLSRAYGAKRFAVCCTLHGISRHFVMQCLESLVTLCQLWMWPWTMGLDTLENSDSTVACCLRHPCHRLPVFFSGFGNILDVASLFCSSCVVRFPCVILPGPRVSSCLSTRSEVSPVFLGGQKLHPYDQK